MKIQAKNKTLYHGTTRTGIKILKPFPHNVIDGESVVFATSDRRFALAMIHGTGNELAVGYFIDQETHKEEMYINELQEGALALLNASGVLYEIVGENFIADPRLSHVEFVSKVETPVMREMYVENILEELKKDAYPTIVPYEEVLDKESVSARMCMGLERFINIQE